MALAAITTTSVVFFALASLRNTGAAERPILGVVEPIQRLALFDLDNTLIDREAAFRSWASRFVQERGLDESAVSWLSSIDDDGVKPRERFFAEIRDRYAFTDSVESLVQGYRAVIGTLIPPLASETHICRPQQ